MLENSSQTIKKNQLTKLQNPALALVIVIEIQIFMEIFTFSLKVVEDEEAKPVAVATKNAKLPTPRETLATINKQ